MNGAERWIEPLGQGADAADVEHPDDRPPPRPPRRMHPRVAAIWEQARTELAAVDLTTEAGRTEARRIHNRAERLTRSLRRALRHDRRSPR